MNSKQLVLMAIALMLPVIYLNLYTPVLAERPSDEEIQKMKEEKQKKIEEMKAEKAKKLEEMKKQKTEETTELMKQKQEKLMEMERLKNEKSNLQKPPVKKDSINEEDIEQLKLMKKEKLDRILSVYPKSENNAKEYREKINGILVTLQEVSAVEEELGNEEVVDELYEVMQDEEETSDSTEDAVQSIEARNKFKTALFGSDFKNLGQLRTNLVRNENQIRKMTKSIEKVQDEESKLAIQQQLVVMLSERERIKSVLTTNENTLGVLGWFSKFLNKYPNNPAVNPGTEEALVDEVNDVVNEEVLDDIVDAIDDDTVVDDLDIE